jgi:hypothetical protein
MAAGNTKRQHSKKKIITRMFRSASDESFKSEEDPARRARKNWKRSINTVIASLRFAKITEEKAAP